MIVRAAIKYLLYPGDDTGGEIILPLHRHCDGAKILKALGFEIGDFKILEQGFLTDADEFLDRAAAAEHAYECGQLDWLGEEDKESVMVSECLMSEDLW